jgi:hypothetical protein
MLWIVENPWPILIVVALGELALLVAFYRTGRVKMTLWMLILAAAAGGYWLLEKEIVTDREQIENNLHAIAAAMVANDVATVESYISKSAKITTLQSAQQVARMKFAEIRINNDLLVTVRDDVDPPQAEATGTVTVVMASGYTGTTVARATVRLRKVDGQWLIYEHEEPRIGIR